MSRSVLVTGASSGIGRATARELANRGFQVFAGVRGESAARTLSGIEGVTPLMFDVTDVQSISAAVRRIEERVGDSGLQGLVNNAGIALGGPLETLPIGHLEQQLRVNVIGQVAVAQACLPMLRRGRGRLLFVASEVGHFTVPMLGAYSASKYAIEAVADALRVELRGSGVRVSLIEPGVIDTPIWNKLATHTQELLAADPHTRQLYEREARFIVRMAILLRRLGTPPERVARAIYRALTTRFPRARLRVGVDARVLVPLFKIAPVALTDYSWNTLLRRLPLPAGNLRRLIARSSV